MNYLNNGGFALLARLYILYKLNAGPEQPESPDALNVVGPDCSSWGVPARSSSMRSYINPYGRLGNAWVTSNTALVGRKLGCHYIFANVFVLIW